MAIADLEIGEKEVDIVVEVIDIGEVRDFSKFGKSGSVATARVKDESGEIAMSLWNEQLDVTKVGSKVHITNGYVTEFQGEKQLTTGKLGKLEVVEGGSSEESQSQLEPESEEKPTQEEETVE